MKDLGLSIAVQGSPFTFLGTHRIYTNNSFGRQALVVNNLPGQLHGPQILKEQNFIILQIPESRDQYTSMALIGISEIEVHQHLKATSYIKKILHQLLPLVSAHAEPCPAPGPRLNGLSQVAGKLQDNYRAAQNCLLPLLQGAWDSTGGMVQSAWAGLRDLVRNPREFWRSKVGQLGHVREFIASFGTKMREMAGALMNLSREARQRIFCSFCGSLGADALMAILTGGAGAAIVMLKMNRYFSKLRRLQVVLVQMNKAGKINDVPPRFYSDLMTSPRADQAINRINIFHTHGMNEVTLGVMRCPL